MYTAKIIEKTQDEVSRLWTVVTEFTNGADIFTEAIVPQDKAGYEHWRDSRLKSLNGTVELVEENNLNVVYTLPATPVPTAAEIAKRLWLERDALKEQVDKAIAKGYLTGTETKVVQLNNWLKTNFKPEYINLV